MKSAARYVLWFIALLCVSAAAVGLAQQIAGSQPIEYALPCTLLVFGAGFAGASALFPDAAARSECRTDEDSNAENESESSVDAT
jgi:hypothetical protein